MNALFVAPLLMMLVVLGGSSCGRNILLEVGHLMDCHLYQYLYVYLGGLSSGDFGGGSSIGASSDGSQHWGNLGACWPWLPSTAQPHSNLYYPTVALMRRRLSCNGAPGRAAGYAGVGSGGALPTVGPSLPTSTTTSYQLMQGWPPRVPPAHHCIFPAAFSA